MTKYICIKEYTCKDGKAFEIGDILDICLSVSVPTHHMHDVYAVYNNSNNLNTYDVFDSLMIKENYDISEYFIPLVEYRKSKINEILK